MDAASLSFSSQAVQKKSHSKSEVRLTSLWTFPAVATQQESTNTARIRGLNTGAGAKIEILKTALLVP